MNTHDIEPLQDAADLLRSYLKLCKSLPRGGSYHLGRIERAIAAFETDRQDSIVFKCGKAAGRQEVKDAQQCPDFWAWIQRAYREPESAAYTVYNMEVAYQAGRASVEAGRKRRGEPVAQITVNKDRSQTWIALKTQWFPEGKHLLYTAPQPQQQVSEPAAYRWKKPIVDDKGETLGYTDWIYSEQKGFLDWWPHESLYANQQPQQQGGDTPTQSITFGPIKVGNLPTANQDDYPDLGDWWVQLRIGPDNDEVLARVYGSTPQQAYERAVLLAKQQPPQIPEPSPLRDSMSSNHRSYVEGWNACRAVMLEAAPKT